MQARNRPVILLIAEAVTLSHFARIVTLAKQLDPSRYEVIVASDPRYIELEAPLEFAFYPIHSIPSAQFAEALARGRPLYTFETLTRYVEDDLALLDRVKPDLVVGDFRLSLAVSAPLRKIAYASVVNAYWSPFADIIYPIPDLPITRVLGVRLAQKLFNIIRPAVFALHATPLNRVRHRFGLPSLEGDLRSTYTWGDYTLYTDISEVVPTHNLPTRHYYLGPVFWSTHTSLPEWWNRVPEEKPVVFLTLGSSGQADLLPMVLNALSRFPITILVATARKVKLAATPANAFIADYLPMNIATGRSQLVICNGGSLATYHALAIGVPVIGLCSNMDQLLNMEALKRIGAGITLRAAQTNIAELIKAVTSALYNLSYRQAAKKIAKLLMQHDSSQCFREIVMEIVSQNKD